MAWTDSQAGATYTLIYNESLTFGNDMEHLLIHTNKSRFFGISVWENPYDAEYPIGIYTRDFFIPFQPEGSTIFFDNNDPSYLEL